MTDDRAVKCAEEIRQQIYDIWKKVRADFGIAGIQSLLGEQIIPATISKHFPTWIRIDGEGTLPETNTKVLVACYTTGGRWTQASHLWRGAFNEVRWDGVGEGVRVLYWQLCPAPPSEGK